MTAFPSTPITARSRPASAGPARNARRLGPPGPPPGWVAPKARLDYLRERRRLRRILRRLDAGDWRHVLVTLKHAQHRYRELLKDDGSIDKLIVKLNLFKAAVRMHATVLAARPARILIDDRFAEQSAFVAAMRSACMLDQRIQRAAKVANAEGEAAVRLTIQNDRVVAVIDDNDETLPIGPRGHDDQPTVWERRWVVTRTVRGEERRYLRVERHRMDGGEAIIENEAYATDSTETLLAVETLESVTLAEALGEEAAAALEPVRRTGLPSLPVVQFVCDVDRGEPALLVTSHDLDLFDAAAANLSRTSRVFEQHGSPRVRVPGSMIDEDGKVRIGADDAIEDPLEQFAYIQVQAAFDQLMAFADRLHGYELISLMMSPALLGVRMQGGSTPDSAEKLRLESTNTIARGEQSGAYFGPALGRVIEVASWMETRRVGNGWAVGPVRAEMRVELPKDRVERARELMELRSDHETPLISHRAALAELHGEDHADEMLAEIEEDLRKAGERNAAALGGEMGFGGGGGAA